MRAARASTLAASAHLLGERVPLIAIREQSNARAKLATLAPSARPRTRKRQQPAPGLGDLLSDDVPQHARERLLDEPWQRRREFL